MSFPSSKGTQLMFFKFLPWLHFLGAVIVVVFSALFSAVYSQLGQEISVGESPGFAWIGRNIITCMGFSLVYLILVCWLQLRHMRYTSFVYSRLPSSLVCLEVLAIAATALLLYYQQASLLPWAQLILLLSILIQGVLTFLSYGLPDVDRELLVFQKSAGNSGFFLVLLFLLGAAISILDPSWRRISDQILLDSDLEYYLRYLFPPVLSGVASVWFGAGMLVILLGCNRLLLKFSAKQGVNRIIYFLTFLCLVAVFTALLLSTLFYAISWQIQKLELRFALGQLFILTSIGGGALFSAVFYRLDHHNPAGKKTSFIGVVAMTFGAALLLPITWLLTLKRNAYTGWMLLLVSILGASFVIGCVILFGDIFNPWFTAASYLKGAMLKILSVVAAGTVMLLIERSFSFKITAPFNFRRLGVILVSTVVLGFLPFYALGKYPEVKAVVLQFNEITRVDTTFARELSNALGFSKWLRIGQRPPQNGNPHPWPQPWRLTKTHPSRLPDNFNLLIIVADALRGDAFHSAGYQRNLTPFLDRWARDEALSFRRAYSQGGGSFAAYPFLVAGRSRLDLYGPGLYQQNLYFKIARAEGIQHYMLMQGFGPRDIYPPELAVTELSIPRTVNYWHSPRADEVFDSARKAILALPTDERFLCFLTLMDVHNNLWKKEDGIDFGDRPKDVYDNNLSYIDRAFGRFVNWLKDKNIYDQTVILFTSDHGEQFWEHGASLHGHTLYEEEIRVPLILYARGIRGRFPDVPVITADMAPTLAEFAGYSVAPPYDDSHMGISLLPLILKNERGPYLKRDVVGRASFKRRYFLYRNWEWKLIYYAELDLVQLFNVIKDPKEKSNLIQEEPELAAEMEKDLFEYLKNVEGKDYRPVLSKSRF